MRFPEVDASVMDMDRSACYRAISTRDARFDGRLFVGVKTTGIYCRPICPARTPNYANVSFYPSAAAAQQAGFRPCLRCRPETSPDLAFWRGTTNTVSRALALIKAGGLDEADVEGLANRLGVGARQLRRLFRQHVGASPVAVAQTLRVLLGQAIDPRDLAADGRSGDGVGLQQYSPFQRNVSSVVRTFAGEPAAHPRQNQTRGRRAVGSSGLPAAL
jgi:methylphosphotriester-DNA--protein-cysteine methyltransferase